MFVRRSPIRVVSYEQDIRVGLKKKIIIFFIKHFLVIQEVVVGRRQRMFVRRSPIRVVSYEQDIRVGLKKKNNYFFYKTPSCHTGGSGR